MVALLVSSLLVGMILAIFLRMSLSYRGQQEIVEVQQKLATARAWMETDAKQAGFAMAQGFRIAKDGAAGLPRSPVVIENSSTGPDTLELYYADAGTQALVVAPTTGWPVTLAVDSAVGFAADDLVVLSTVTMADGLNPGFDAKLATYRACVLKIQGVSGNTVSLVTALPWGLPAQGHCDVPDASQTMLYKFVARAYRIDPARPAEGVLQLSRTGNLDAAATQFEDVGFDFTDLQVAGYFYDNLVDTGDPDSDPKRNWYSSNELDLLTEPNAALVPILQLAFSFVARTGRNVEGVSTAFTPSLTGLPIANNMLGDHPSVDLATTSDPRLQGARIYRYTTSYVDLRNLGVGR